MAIARPAAGAVPAQEEDFTVRKLDLHDLRVSLAQGWDDFLSKRGDLVFVGIIYPVAVLVAVLYALNTSLLPLFFPLLAGTILFGPAAASGFYELARRRELGLDSRWRHFIDVVSGPKGLSLFMLSTVLALLFILWVAVAGFIYTETVGAAYPKAIQTVASFLGTVLTTSEGWRMMIIGNLVGLGFAMVALAISVVSFPMMVDKEVRWSEAMRTSVRVTMKNPGTIAMWGLIVVALLVVGSVPAFVGLAVVLPVLGYATWHLYTRAVVR
jgi:uncharacterized membrane protein